MSSLATGGQPRRELSIDQLRALVVLGLIFFHTARLFDSEAWHIKHPQTFLLADVLIAVFNIVGMPLLFLLAGMSAYASLGSRGPGAFIGERVGRLFVPLVTGMLIVVPLQVYLERVAHGVALRASSLDFTGSFLEFYPTYFACCYPDGNLSWHHLWFLASLFVFSLLLLPVLLLLRRCLAGRDPVASGGIAAMALVCLGLPLLPIEIGLRPSFPSSHALIDDFANDAHYLWLMLAGALLMASAKLRQATRHGRRWWLLATIALCAAWLSVRFGLVPAPLNLRLGLRATAEWSALAALLGYGAVYLVQPIPLLTRFGAIAMPFYVVHQTVIVLLGFWTINWVEAPLAKYAVVAAVSMMISVAAAQLAHRFALTRIVFGLKPMAGT
jgi:surface polysaccharide O-acyltransferase-like enzyme